MCLLGLNTTKAQTYNFADYLYPYGCRTFSLQNSKGETTGVSQFSFTSQTFDNYLVEEVYIGIGQLSAKNTYRYRVEGNAVISDVQIRQNVLMGSSKYQDKITLFAFPNNDKPYTWSEVDRNDKISGKSEYVYIKFLNRRTKAIKITKTTYTNNHKYEEKSFWVEDYGRIVTFNNIDDGEEKISSKNIDINEIFVWSNFQLNGEENEANYIDLQELKRERELNTQDSLYLNWSTKGVPADITPNVHAIIKCRDTISFAKYYDNHNLTPFLLNVIIDEQGNISSAWLSNQKSSVNNGLTELLAHLQLYAEQPAKYEFYGISKSINMPTTEIVDVKEKMQSCHAYSIWKEFKYNKKKNKCRVLEGGGNLSFKYICEKYGVEKSKALQEIANVLAQTTFKGRVQIAFTFYERILFVNQRNVGVIFECELSPKIIVDSVKESGFW